MKIVGRLFASLTASAIFGLLCVAQASGQQLVPSGASLPADNIVRDASGRVDYMVDLYPEAPRAYASQLTQPSRFASYHKPQVVNAVADFERYYGIQAHSVVSWTVAGFTAFMDEATASRVRADTRVRNMEPNRYGTYSIQSLNDPGAVWADNLTSDPLIKSWGKMAVNPSTAASNQTATVYLVDGGAGVHQDLNIVAWINPDSQRGGQCDTRAPLHQTCNASNLSANLVGCYTHATGTAGVIGGSPPSGSGTYGINPNVRIVSVIAQSTPDPIGQCVPYSAGAITGDTISVALDWVANDILAQNLPQPAVVNLSLNVTPMQRRMLDAIKKLTSPDPTNHGAFVAQSAGNGYTWACNNVYNDGSGQTFPNDGIMVVGAINNHGQPVVPFVPYTGLPSIVGFWKDALALGYDGGSNYGSCVDTWAPGDGIYTSLANPGTALPQVSNPGTPYTTYGMGSGTSFSAPHVAGLATLVIEQHPGLTTPGAVEQFIHDNYSRSLGVIDHDGYPITMPSTVAVPSPAHKTYGELIINVGTPGTPSFSVNGYPVPSSTPGYDGEAPHTGFVAYYGMPVDFHVTGGTDCAVTRTSGSTTQSIGGASSFIHPVTQAWNEGMGGVSSIWTVSSTCFPQGARITSYSPNPALTLSGPATLYPTQSPATITLSTRNNGYQTTGQSRITFKFDTASASSLSGFGLNGTNWQCNSAQLTCTHSNVLATNAQAEDIALTFNVGLTPPTNVTVTATFDGGGLVTSVPVSKTFPVTFPDLQASLITSGGFYQGEPGATYIARVSNLSPGPTTSAISVSGTIPAGMNNVSMSGCTLLAPQNGATPFTCSIPSLGANTHVDFNLAADIATDATSLTTAMNVSGGGDTTQSNDSASDTQLVAAKPNLSVQMTGPGIVGKGQPAVTYTINVSNIGHASTSGAVTVQYTLPSGFTRTGLSYGTTPTWDCSASTVGLVSCTQSNALASGQAYNPIVVTESVASNAALGSVAHSAQLAGTNPGGDVTSANNSSSVNTLVTAPADASVQVTPGTSSFVVRTTDTSSSAGVQSAVLTVFVQQSVGVSSVPVDPSCVVTARTGGGPINGEPTASTVTYQCNLGNLSALAYVDKTWNLSLSNHYVTGSANVTASVSTATYDPVSTNNSASGSVILGIDP